MPWSLLIIDGERVELKSAVSDRETLQGSAVSETFAYSIDYKLLKKIAYASKIEARLGDYVLNFEQRREPLRILCNRFN